MDEFTRQYLETALWSSIAGNDAPMDRDHGISDIAPETVAEAEADCARFRSENAEHLDAFDDANDDPTLAGHCFWLNRNGHGTGFWDRKGDDAMLEALSKACEEFGEVNLYDGDDGKIYA